MSEFISCCAIRFAIIIVIYMILISCSINRSSYTYKFFYLVSAGYNSSYAS
uniref:Uncharacterized protein n=1 Tax=CrAss-like virus sp. ctYsL76 TaxID=2826826 RepID=A0A8S5QML0_9CAUD|nr:MAG TPA: hypothetical protein [CrAss-like virus sp. ctYsL76]